MIVYITKFALTQGIKEREVIDKGKGTVLTVDGPYPVYYYGEGKEWCRTWDEATKVAERMRDYEIKKHEYQIQKYKKIKFEPPV